MTDSTHELVSKPGDTDDVLPCEEINNGMNMKRFT